MNTSDFIALGAVLIAFLAAYYARHSRDAARRANKIAVHESRRPLRLAVFQSMTLFAQYCSKYVTMVHMESVKGTRDLVARLHTFKWEIEQQGELGMPEVSSKAQEFINGAWQMQRLLDRIAGGHPAAMDAAFASAEEQIDALVEWFGAQDRELKDVFRPYQAEV